MHPQNHRNRAATGVHDTPVPTLPKHPKTHSQALRRAPLIQTVPVRADTLRQSNRPIGIWESRASNMQEVKARSMIRPPLPPQATLAKAIQSHPTPISHPAPQSKWIPPQPPRPPVSQHLPFPQDPRRTILHPYNTDTLQSPTIRWIPVVVPAGSVIAPATSPIPHLTGMRPHWQTTPPMQMGDPSYNQSIHPPPYAPIPAQKPPMQSNTIQAVELAREAHPHPHMQQQEVRTQQPSPPMQQHHGASSAPQPKLMMTGLNEATQDPGLMFPLPTTRHLRQQSAQQSRGPPSPSHRDQSPQCEPQVRTDLEKTRTGNSRREGWDVWNSKVSRHTESRKRDLRSPAPHTNRPYRTDRDRRPTEARRPSPHLHNTCQAQQRGTVCRAMRQS